MLKVVLGLLFFFLLPSMLPSREPLTLVPCDSGSANIIEPVLFVGEGGPDSWPIMARALRGWMPFCCDVSSVTSLGVSAAANGFNEAIRLVGSEGTQRA